MYNLYTIGYSGFDMNGLIDTLSKQKVNALVDVRSFPYSKTFPAFNKDNLTMKLSQGNIHYIPMCEQLGARPEDFSLYSDGQVDFKKIANSDRFRKGCERLYKGLAKYTVCLLCSENDPVICHRAILVAHNMNLRYKDLEIAHFVGSEIETHSEMEKRLLQITGCDQCNLWGTSGIEQAYAIQSAKIAYRQTDLEPNWQIA